MSQLKALIFDVDGTLADTERDGHRVAFNQAFQESGLEWEWDETLYGELLTVTGGKERIRYFIDTHQPTFNPPEGLTEFAARIHKRKTQIYLELLQSGRIPLRTGVKRVLEEARQAGIRLAIATTTTPENVTYLLEATLGAHAIDWFECIAAGDIVPAKKPAPDIYHYTLAQLQLDATHCLAVEDSDNGIRSAHAAGLKTLITVNDYTCEHNFQAAAVVLDQLGEPDQPFQVLQGEAHGFQYVTLAYLQQLMA